ncbi:MULTISPECIES: hypothetical protein [Sphingobium]|uniref:hypothetical protein n=1 Tax=Sphingobium TaxID=165695 RepID=UPI0009326E9A|nr:MULTISPECIES: hypothetical protein [Sphingobium]
MAKAHNNDELNDAMKRGESTIEIEGDLAKKIIRLKATGNVAWAIAIGAIAIATLAAIVAIPATVVTGGLAAPVEGVAVTAALAPAVATLGLDIALMALGLAVSAGGVGVLTRLRSNYKIVEQAPDHVVLAKM